MFKQRLRELGWIEGRNIFPDLRWGLGDLETRRKYARELVALAPDMIMTSTAVGVEALQEQTRTIRIVFSGAIDPVGSGLVESLAHPGGNTTRFLTIEYGIGAKWLELLKEIAPQVTRVATLRAPTVPGSGQFGAIQSVAPAFKVEVRPVYAEKAEEIERAVTAFARAPNGGLIATIAGIVTGANIRDDVIPAMAARLYLP